MKKDEGLTELIYEYYESRILFGYYRYGEQLVSLSQICSTFRVGRNTVLAALKKLEEKGYIVTEERKVARITYQGTDEIFLENTAKYFVPRKEGILDFSLAGKLLLLPMWEAGLHNPEPDTIRPDTGRPDIMSTPISLYFDVLRTFHNDLLMNLYWQCLRYLSFLYPKRKSDKVDSTAEELSPHGTVDELNRNFDYLYTNVQKQVLDFIDSASKKYHMEQVGQIPFKWTVYRQRPQVRYTLASIIIREVLWERCPVGSYLPSLPRMAEQYQVSLSTVRRTLAVLQSLGVTRTYMGIGTKVCLEPVDFKVLNTPEIKENLRLHGEGLQLLALTVRGVTLYTLESVTEQKRRELWAEITKLQGKTSSILCMDVLLSFISSECPSGIIRECYGKLRELEVWGYILSAVLMENGQLDFRFEDTMIQMKMDLQAGHLTAFADQWKTLIESRMNFFNSKFPLTE